jgi:KDO2-lipid IV(A) lauroyltransferase
VAIPARWLNLEHVALINLRIAFPHLSVREHQRIYLNSLLTLLRLIYDTLRLPFLTKKWVEKHVDTTAFQRIIIALKEDETLSGRGVFFLTGHIGSFDILALVIAYYFKPSYIVIREQRPRWLNTFIVKAREKCGNKMFYRERALLKIIRYLKRGEGVGLLFDQNVTANNAIFVEWFGKPAATTPAPALAIIASKCVPLICGTRYLGKGQYEILVEKVEVKSDDPLTLTANLVTKLEQIIYTYPEGWFWFHKRFKTRPAKELENLYS